MIQLNPIHVKEVTHELENNYNIIILYLYFYNIILYNYNIIMFIIILYYIYCQSSEPHIRLPCLGVSH